MSPRVATFVFDSPDTAMLEQGLAEGRLPSLAGLVERGRVVILDDLQEYLTSASIQTLAHGCSTAAHRLVYPTQLVPGTYAVAPVGGEQAEEPPFWRHLSDAGLRSVIVSPYGAAFMEGLRGVQVSGWGSHDAYTRDVWRSEPPGLVGELERRFGPRTLRYDEPPPQTPAAQRGYIERMVRGTHQQTAAMRWLLEHEEWDFFLGYFADCHQAGHYLWHLTVPGGDDPDPPEPDLTHGLPEIYGAVDEGLGALIEALSDDTVVLVVNATTMGPHHGLGEAVEPVLEAAGWLTRSSGVPLTTRQRALSMGRRAVRATVPPAGRRALGRALPRDRLVGELSHLDVDWSRTRAFQLPSDGSTAIRLNVAGREPQGIVRPGTDYERACAELRELFLSLEVPGTGERLARDVKSTEELLGVPVAGPLPDVCVSWTRVRDVHAVTAPGLGTVEFPRTDPRKCLHWSPGFMVAAGPGVEASGGRGLQGPDAGLADVAATIFDLLGVAPAGAMDGTPIDRRSRSATRP